MNLEKDENYYQFVHDIALELRSDAMSAFAVAECDNAYKPHFMADLIQAMQANERKFGE